MTAIEKLIETVKTLLGFTRTNSDAEFDADEQANSAADIFRQQMQRMQKNIEQDPRRYKRASLLARGAGVQHEIASASMLYRGRNHLVVDLSHTGIAIERGSAKADGVRDDELPASGVAETVTVTLGRLAPLKARVVMTRASDEVVAFEFSEVSTEARLAIDRFLDPKMIGLNMRPVDRAFFSAGETFSLWFSGPRDTNFFLWMVGGRLERSIIQLGDEHFTLHRSSDGTVVFARTELKPPSPSGMSRRAAALFALDVALQVPSGGEVIAGLVGQLTAAADSLPAKD